LNKADSVKARVNLKAPIEINAELMTTLELHDKLQEGYDDIEAGRVADASGAFNLIREKHSI
jgi:hypothetical protein